MSSTDILKKLSIAEIKQLRDVYKNHREKLPHIYSFLHTALEWDKKKPDENLIVIYAPHDDSWKTSGTFIATILPSSSLRFELLVLYTLEESAKILKDALINSNKIDWFEKPVFFFALQEQFKTLIEDIMTKHKGLINRESTDTNIWRIKKEDAILRDPICPDGFVFGELTQDHAEIINELWPHKAPGSEKFVSTMIEMGGGYGVFQRSDHQLASWVLVTPIGQLGLLQTKPEFSKKGLAICVTDKLAHNIALNGYDVIGTVLLGNKPSISLFTKLQYEVIGLCHFALYSK